MLRLEIGKTYLDVEGRKTKVVYINGESPTSRQAYAVHPFGGLLVPYTMSGQSIQPNDGLDLVAEYLVAEYVVAEYVDPVKVVIKEFYAKPGHNLHELANLGVFICSDFKLAKYGRSETCTTKYRITVEEIGDE